LVRLGNGRAVIIPKEPQQAPTPENGAIAWLALALLALLVIAPAIGMIVAAWGKK
jgi:hypothetical protein